MLEMDVLIGLRVIHRLFLDTRASVVILVLQCNGCKSIPASQGTLVNKSAGNQFLGAAVCCQKRGSFSNNQAT